MTAVWRRIHNMMPMTQGDDTSSIMLPISAEALYVVAISIMLVSILYIFYPALLVLFADAVPVKEEVVSPCKNGKPLQRDRALLSIVIPAYNEEERLPIMLCSAVEYITSNRKLLLDTCRAIGVARGLDCSKDVGVEWLVVSDGSTDGTGNVTRQFGKKDVTEKENNDVWKLVSLQVNSGKGAAVKAGMMRASGQVCLMVDADGATEFGPALQSVLEALLQHYESANASTKKTGTAVFGSRAHLEESTEVARRSLVRNCLMYAFHFFVKVLCSSRIHDTQCGFKLFTHDANLALFGNLHLRRWAFDTELVVLAERQGIPILEVPVPWHEVDGSKLHTSKLALALVSLSMLRDMICVRACYTLRIWNVKHY